MPIIKNRMPSLATMYAPYRPDRCPPTPEHVSPPSSPEMAGRERNLNRDVSPIDWDDDHSRNDFPSDKGQATVPIHAAPLAKHSRQPVQQPQQTYHQPVHQLKSSIPLMQSERRKPTASAASSREMRAIPRVRPGAAPVRYREPQVYAWESLMAHGVGMDGRYSPSYSGDGGRLPLGMTTTIYSDAVPKRAESPSLGQRMRRLGRGNKAEPIESRPAWNGQSGRQALVNPVRDDTSVAPIKLPQRSSGYAEIPDYNSPNLPPSGARQDIHTYKRDDSPPYRNSSRQVDAQSHPNLFDTDPPLSSPYQPNPAPPVVSATVSMSNPYPNKAIKRKAPPANAHIPQLSIPSKIYPAQFEPLSLELVPQPLNTMRGQHTALQRSQEQPQSRFSITTYATSAPTSPYQSDGEEPSPLSEQPPASPVMNRRRPIQGGENDSWVSSGVEPIVISLRSASIATPYAGMAKEATKPVPPSNIKTNPPHPSSILSSTKALPPAPPEMDASKDRVELLSAKLEGLAHRRLNINRSIAQMTELMPRDRLMASEEVLRRREEEKKKVERLKEELAEVQQEEYELGIKLHRAHKRQERESLWESESLWVKRAVGV